MSLNNPDLSDDQWANALGEGSYAFISTPQVIPANIPNHEALHLPNAHIPTTPSGIMNPPIQHAAGPPTNPSYILYTPLSLPSGPPAYYAPQQLSTSAMAPPQFIPAYPQIQPYSSASLARTTSFSDNSPPMPSDDNVDDDPPSPTPSASAPSSSSQGNFKCEWRGCKYAGAFGRRAELKRHIETKHVYPNNFQCHFARCRKQYNRKDNLEEHLKRSHDHQA